MGTDMVLYVLQLSNVEKQRRFGGASSHTTWCQFDGTVHSLGKAVHAVCVPNGERTVMIHLILH